MYIFSKCLFVLSVLLILAMFCQLAKIGRLFGVEEIRCFRARGFHRIFPFVIGALSGIFVLVGTFRDRISIAILMAALTAYFSIADRIRMRRLNASADFIRQMDILGIVASLGFVCLITSTLMDTYLREMVIH
jgi:hypothetical protein